MKRRRTFSGGGGTLTLSSTSGTFNAASNSTSITVYWNDELLKSSDVTVTYGGSAVSSASYSNSTGKVSINIPANTGSSRSGTVIINYKGQTVLYLITQLADSVSYTSYSYSGFTGLGGTLSIGSSSGTGTREEITISFTISSVTAYYSTRTTTYYYISGRSVSGGTSSGSYSVSTGLGHASIYISGDLTKNTSGSKTITVNYYPSNASSISTSYSISYSTSNYKSWVSGWIGYESLDYSGTISHSLLSGTKSFSGTISLSATADDF